MADYTKISKNRVLRYAGLLAFADSDPAAILEKAINMSETDRKDYIQNFVKQHGVRQTFSIIKSMIGAVTSKTSEAAMHEGLNKKPGEQISTRDSEGSKIKHLLNKAGDWSVLLTFFLMWAAVSTSDYYTLHLKHPAANAELRAFLIVSGSAFMAWVFKKLASLFK